MQVYSLISSLKTYHLTLHLTPWSLDLFIRVPFQLHGEHTVLPRTQHLSNVPRLRGEKHDISLKILHQAGFETARQAATSAERHALTIAPCPSRKPRKSYPSRQSPMHTQSSRWANINLHNVKIFCVNYGLFSI